MISGRTRRELGRAVDPHLFRKLIPTELAIHDPEHVGVAQAMLGHADYRTTERAYNMARALDAARRYQLVLGVAAGAVAGGPSRRFLGIGLLEAAVIAVIYARYNSDQQRQASIDDQVRICRRLDSVLKVQQ